MGDRNIDVKNGYFYNNSTFSTGGGALYVGGSSGLSIEKTTFYSNAASTSNGGALFINSSSHSVVNCTFYQNGAANGGAIYTNDPFGNVSLTSTTVYANTASTDGGGFYMNGGISMTHTVLAGNTASGIDNDFTRDAANQPNLISNDYNFIGYDPGSEVFGPDPNDQIGTTAPIDPMLGLFQDNGGYASTLMPVPGSPLVDAGDLSTISFVTEDQTGASRAINGVPDIGAVEYTVACNPLIVTKTTDDGSCGTLRAAIEYANQNPYSVISFDQVEGVITLNNALPVITGEGTDLQGLSNFATPVRIDGQGVSIGLNIQADYVSISGVSLENFTGFGIIDMGYNALSVKGIYMGINPESNQSISGPDTGIFIMNAYDIFLGQPEINQNFKVASTTNVVANCTDVGIYFDNVIGEITNSYIGTDLDGELAYPNQIGIYVNNSNSSLSINNVLISGNTTSGIHIANSSFISVSENTIGLNESQVSSLENGIGLQINNSNNLTIGPGNYISGNDDQGIYAEDSRELTIIGNNIGLNIKGEMPLNDGYSNWPGIELENTPAVVVGGTSSSDRNIIAGNLNGVQVNNGSDSVVILGNYFGLDPTGLKPVRGSGISIGVVRSDYAKIGDGTVAGQNIIAGNEDGVSFTRADNFLVDGNVIGFDATGIKKTPGNHGNCIRISNVSSARTNDTIRNNVLAYSNGTGILITTSIDSVIVTQNSIYGNDPGILLNTNSNAQQGVKAPVVSGYDGTAYFGTSAPDAKIEVFADKTDQGEFFLGSTQADINGDWTLSYDNTNIPLGLNYITAIQDSAGQSSVFSAPYEWQDCSYLSANVISQDSYVTTCVDTVVLEAEVPSIGTGQWDCVTSGGTIRNPSSPSVTIEDLTVEYSEYKWVVTDGTCQVESYIDVYYDAYKDVDAGEDQVVTIDEAVLNGTPLTEGETGGELPIEWSILSGDGEFDAPGNPNAIITGLAPGLNVILFTALPEFGFCPGLDTVEVFYNLQYAKPDAGEDQLVCLGETKLDANYPGTNDDSFGWTFASGPNTPTFEDPLDPKTRITGLIDGTYELVWNIDDGDSNERDTVEIVSATGPARPTPNGWLVNNINNTGCGSLRQAVFESSAGDTIYFDSGIAGQLIDLTGGEIVIEHELTLIGSSPKVQLQNLGGPVFTVDVDSDFNLENIEFVNSENALKILTAQQVNIDSVCFRYNERAILDSSSARLYITKSIFDENEIYDNGAGIHKTVGGNIEIDSSRFVNNWSDDSYGAAIFARDLYLSIRYSELDRNIASMQGGAVYLEGGYLNVYSSTFINNTAFEAGGAVAINNFLNREGYASIVNATFSNNFCDGYGGAIAADTSELNIAFSTIVRNNTYSGAGGIYSSDQNIFLKSTIVAENAAYGSPFDIECEGCLVRSFGNNFIGDSTGVDFQFSGVGDTLGNASTQADPLLEDLLLVNNMFHIHLPMENSPVIDAGGFQSSYGVDQRGVERPYNGEENASDIGAVEHEKSTQCNFPELVYNTDSYVEIYVEEIEGMGYELSWYSVVEQTLISDEDTLYVYGDDRVVVEVYDPATNCNVTLDTIEVVYLYTELNPQDDFIEVPEDFYEFEIPYYDNDDISPEQISQVYLYDPQTDAPTYGEVVFPDVFTMLYSPYENYYGNDTLRYEVEDFCGNSGNAQVIISVTPNLPDFPDVIERNVISGDSATFVFLADELLTDYGISDSLNNGKGKITLDLVHLIVKVDYSLAPDFVGEDSMQFYFCKGTACDSTYLKVSIANFVEESVGLEVFNGVSPNGDGKNDYLIIQMDDVHRPLKLFIANRWGDRVFETDNYDNESNNWDGDNLPDGTYYYFLKADNGEERKGVITLKK